MHFKLRNRLMLPLKLARMYQYKKNQISKTILCLKRESGKNSDR